jgi:hypothetical protein
MFNTPNYVASDLLQEIFGKGTKPESPYQRRRRPASRNDRCARPDFRSGLIEPYFEPLKKDNRRS